MSTLVIIVAYLVIVLVLYLRPTLPAAPAGKQPQPVA